MGVRGVHRDRALDLLAPGRGARILGDLGLLSRPMGQLVLAVAMTNDVVGWILLGAVASVAESGSVSVLDLVVAVAGMVLVSLVVLGLGSRFLDRTLVFTALATAGRPRRRKFAVDYLYRTHVEFNNPIEDYQSLYQEWLTHHLGINTIATHNSYNDYKPYIAGDYLIASVLHSNLKSHLKNECGDEWWHSFSPSGCMKIDFKRDWLIIPPFQLSWNFNL